MTKAIKKAHPSWKTTLGAGLAALVVIFEKGLIPYLDSDDLTQPDVALVMTAVFGFLALWFARDNSVSSEQAGAKSHVSEPIK